MVEENNVQTQSIQETQPTIDKVNVRENNILNLTELSNDDLMDFYEQIDKHIKYLKNNILEEEEE